jgi:hypothetical protein
MVPSSMSGVLRMLLLVPPLALSFHVHPRLSDFIFLSLIFAAGLNRRPEKSPLYVGHESVGMGGCANALAATPRAARMRTCRVITVFIVCPAVEREFPRSTATEPTDSQSVADSHLSLPDNHSFIRTIPICITACRSVHIVLEIVVGAKQCEAGLLAIRLATDLTGFPSAFSNDANMEEQTISSSWFVPYNRNRIIMKSMFSENDSDVAQLAEGSAANVLRRYWSRPLVFRGVPGYSMKES